MFVSLLMLFETFSETKGEEDKLNPLYFVSSPDCTWDAGLKYTSMESENVREADFF